MTRGYRLHDRQKEALGLLAGPQRHTLVYGGSRSGKTFLLVRALVVRALRFRESRHLIARFRGNAVIKSIYLDTLPKVMKLCFPQVVMTPHRQDGYVSFANQSEIWFGGLDDDEAVEKILGNEYLTIYLNECSQIPHSSVLMARTRLAQTVAGATQRAYYDLNPTGTGHWTYKEFIERVAPGTGKPLANPGDYAHTYINPDDNRENLAPEYLEELNNLPEKQRRRFKDGQYVAEVDGALWTLQGLERIRVDFDDVPLMQRVVVAVDPSGAKGPEDVRSDDIGIVAAGLGQDGRAYVLEDATAKLSPERWGRRAIETAVRHKADCIVGEVNYGGDMVRAVIQSQANAHESFSFKMVTASRGKVVRAEPIAGLYEQDKVRHVGRFAALEEEMSNFSTAGYTGTRSPNRADALVWALTDLMLGPKRSGPQVRRL
jgi:predicted phage terminase large subunit-like protein